MFKASTLGQMWEKVALHILCPTFLLRDESSETFPHYFVSEEAFVLKVKPRKIITNKRHIFHYRLSRAWKSVKCMNLMFIGPCTIAIVEEWKTNLMSLAIFFFHLLCTQHVSDINISIFRSLRLCRWITTSVVLFSVRCVLEFLLRLIFGGVRFAGWSKCFNLQNEHHQISAAAKTPTHNELRTRRPMW